MSNQSCFCRVTDGVDRRGYDPPTFLRELRGKERFLRDGLNHWRSGAAASRPATKQEWAKRKAAVCRVLGLGNALTQGGFRQSRPGTASEEVKRLAFLLQNLGYQVLASMAKAEARSEGCVDIE